MGPGGSRFKPGCPDHKFTRKYLYKAMNRKFFKYHALGNDYIIIDPSRCGIPITKKTVSLLCNRRKGIGADGVLLGPLSYKKNGRFVRIFNSDGSEASKSGNGLRIFARYLYDYGYENKPDFIIAANSGETGVSIVNNGFVTADMGKVSFNPSDIPAKANNEIVSQSLHINGAEYFVTALSIGIPHVSVLCDEISGQTARTIGPHIENNPIFPQKTNVHFLQVISPDKLAIEIWERGSGYTLASGSSACAALAAALKLGLASQTATVVMPGGSVTCKEKHGSYYLSGPVSFVYEGELSEEFIKEAEE